MVRYYSFLINASIWLLTVLFFSAKFVPVSSASDATYKDYVEGDVKIFFQEFTNIDQSSNAFVKFLRDSIETHIEAFEEYKKEIQYALNKGTKMEKKIRNVSHTLKNSTIPLSKKIQLDLEEIGKNVTTELARLTEMSNFKDIDDMKKNVKDLYIKIQEKIESIAKFVLSKDSTSKVTRQVLQSTTLEFTLQIFDFLKMMIPVAVTSKKNAETISNKMEVTYNTLSKIRSALNEVERIQYDLLISRKDHSKTDGASSICLLAQCVFAIIVGMLF